MELDVVEEKLASLEREKTQLWGHVNAFPKIIEDKCDKVLNLSHQYTESKVMEARLKMILDQQEAISRAADEFGKKLDAKLKEETSWIKTLKNNIVNWALLAAIGGGVMYSTGAKALIGG